LNLPAAFNHRLVSVLHAAIASVAVAASVSSHGQTGLLDFSTCGYAAQARPIPSAPVRVVVSPQPGDNTARIQAAIDHVAGLPADTVGLRGAVLLLSGRHEVLGGLLITNSGVVLRGQGMGADGTTLVAAGFDRRTLVRVSGRRSPAPAAPLISIGDSQVSVGSTTFHVEPESGLRVGDAVRVIRPCTSNWIAQLRATDFGGGVGGGWKPGSRDIVWDRMVTAVDGNRVTIDAPLTTALDALSIGPVPGRESTRPAVGYLQMGGSPGTITNIGIENLTLESTFDPANAKDENHSWCAVTMEDVADAWVRQVTFKHFAGSAVALYETCRRITVQDCLSLAPVSEIGGYRRHTFFTMGQQTLFLRCYAEHGRHDFSVGHCAAGPNAFVQCEADQALADSGPIESWASGVLYDNVNIDGNALTLGFRPGNNAGIGWMAANCVLWNCSASVIGCWNPPGASNWSFGSWASFEGDGEWRSSNDFVKPDSLFAAQLEARLGTEASGRLRLMPRPREESSNPPLDRAQELAAASHRPPPQLRDYILTASQREPIPCEPGDAVVVESILPKEAPSLRAPRSTLLVTNGWLTVDGRLLIGGTTGVQWWRGNVRPKEAPSFGLGVTRFVPGRAGPGFTDDLEDVGDTMQARGLAALDHHYGLWYDRRRDDHERTRRIDGDVLPPFYEQPFARSGQGTAWDGLSKYDLTKFNPWYWSRLREFAGVCDERGLVLFHQNYFQHNILEAGAHWADFPWRSANNINNTGFPEPPPYAGDKRIFQAELFYDVNDPVRRKLHEAYIHQCLDNFTNSANVIQFTSAEFTGPLEFMQFWFDTIAEWKRGEIRSPKSEVQSPLIALSATKDVQDAILADPTRSAIVDIIDFRYWWRTDKGEFAPPGGKNLAPRQFERQWRGGRPNDLNLAAMAAECRSRFPGKPLICDFDAAGWAWVCAGGSMPRLPRTTDAELLAAIPRMAPWPEATGAGRRALREKHRQILVHGGAGSELDLSDESGSFRLSVVNVHTGEVTFGETLKAGGRVKLPDAAVIWLVKQ